MRRCGQFDELGASSTRNVGMVQLFRGRAVDDDPEYPDPGGLGPDPVRIIVGTEEGVNESLLGRRLASGDLNGDGRADLLIGQHGFDGESGNNHGAARVFLGGPLEGPVRRMCLLRRLLDGVWT